MIISATLKAKEFLTSIGYSQPGDFTIEEMVWSAGVFFKEEPLEGSEGRILMDNETAIITVNSNITYQPKKNFIMAHELGHYFLHRNLTQLFSDTEKTLSEWLKNEKQEQEANEFAKELLMPEIIFKPLCKGKLTVKLIKELANKFHASITATLLRYKDLGDFPIAVIYVEKGIVKWAHFTNDFVLQYLPIGSKVRPGTVAYDFFFNNGELTGDGELVDAIDWFPEDFNIKRYLKWKFYEYCHNVSKEGLLICLWGY